ncbi:MAG: restriction endonuclease subunit S [Alistipes sp.]|nr:restriction endonuclease subunit S [Alistipes sp.]
MINIAKYRLKDIATVEISGVDKKYKEGESPVRLCNFVDVYYNWAITSEMENNFMEATARPNEIERFKLKKGQVALTKDSETRFDIGIATYIADDFDNIILGYHNALITPNPEKLNGKYLNALLHTDYARKYFANNASGSGQRYALSVDALNDFPVPLIPLEEQIRIGNIFSSLDQKISLNRAINDNLEAMAKQLYDYWFVQFDFPNEEGKPYKSSGGKMVWNEKLKREIPEGWYADNICRIADILSGGTPSKQIDSYWQNGNIPFFGPTDYAGAIFQLNTAEHITSDGLKYCASSLFEEGVVIITARGSIGKLVIVGTPMAMNQSCYAFRSRNNEFEYLYFLTAQLIEHLKAKGSGSVFKSIITTDIENSILSIADETTITLFTSTIRPLMNAIKENTKQIEVLTKQRDELLPLLMNGQVSVNYHLSHD